MKCVAMLLACSACAGASAELVGSWSIGAGSSTSHLQFQFTNGNTYLYDISYDGAMSGAGLLAIVSASQPGFFGYTTEQYPFGIVLLGVSIGSDADIGFGTPPDYLDYWHYWTREASETAWTESWTGFGDRAVTDGSWDGWVFNSNAAPAAVPTPGAAVAIALSAAWTGMRRHRGSRRR